MLLLARAPSVEPLVTVESMGLTRYVLHMGMLVLEVHEAQAD